ncbi:hypothetical protein ACFWA6_33565 [Streptomyces sp. NPDC060020]|uniref:hypothetical protein n=1 Tax=Streptomyces sp. NPDC060020 TaxID=3347038 RepID=UPI0036BD6173
MSDNQQQRFYVQIKEAAIIPDEAAVREFWSQFNTALESDAKLKARFEDDPGLVLSERGLALDVQRELLLAAGVAGASADCYITCVITTIVVQ